MEDISKSEKTKPDDSSKEIIEEKTSEQETEEIKDEQVEETIEATDEPKEEPEQKTEETDEKEVTQEKMKDSGKKEEKKEKSKKKVDRGKDFKYIVRLSNTDVDGEKNIVYGLTSIKGIGIHMATLIANEIGIDRYTKIGDLKDSQIEKIQELIDKVSTMAPNWMLNHRKDLETGEDIHLIGSDIDMRLRDEINILKKIRSYRGIRHERGLRARGQRTRANNRRGLALGVSKKRESK
ncbi:MAG: 30S ribosomal protein S13 [Thermoplasmatales archaeon]|nr:MAG: 30S ribosomal protein S13 [Thermoplasmatales archaeon]